MSSYFHDLLTFIFSISYTISSSSPTLTFNSPSKGVEPTVDPTRFREEAAGGVRRVLRNWMDKTATTRRDVVTPRPGGSNPSVLFPVVQMGRLGLRQDETVTKAVLERVGSEVGLELDMTSGYLNFTDEYIELLAKRAGVRRILTAAPEVSDG